VQEFTITVCFSPKSCGGVAVVAVAVRYHCLVGTEPMVGAVFTIECTASTFTVLVTAILTPVCTASPFLARASAPFGVVVSVRVFLGKKRNDGSSSSLALALRDAVLPRRDGVNRVHSILGGRRPGACVGTNDDVRRSARGRHSSLAHQSHVLRNTIEWQRRPTAHNAAAAATAAAATDDGGVRVVDSGSRRGSASLHCIRRPSLEVIDALFKHRSTRLLHFKLGGTRIGLGCTLVVAVERMCECEWK